MSREELFDTRGWRRHVLMDALIRHAALTVTEVARLLGLSPSTVSNGRKRLNQRHEDHAAIGAALASVAKELGGL